MDDDFGDGLGAPHQDGPYWDDKALRDELDQIAAQRGKSIGQILTEAGYTRDLLKASPSRDSRTDEREQGRNTKTLIKVAKAFGLNVWDVIAMGLKGAGPPSSGAHTALAPESIQQLGRLALSANLMAHLYVALDGRRTTPAVVDVDRLVNQIMSMLPPDS